MPEFYIIFARKINKIPEFYMIYARKINKMPEFYTIFALKIVFAGIWGGGNCPRWPPISYAYGYICTSHLMFFCVLILLVLYIRIRPLVRYNLKEKWKFKPGSHGPFDGRHLTAFSVQYDGRDFLTAVTDGPSEPGAVNCEKLCEKALRAMLFGRPYYRSRLCYTKSSVCLSVVCLWRFVLRRNGTS